MTDDLEDRLIAALGDEPARTSTIDAAGHEVPEDDATYQARLDEWRDQWAAVDLADADYAGRRHRQIAAKLGAIDALARDRIAEITEWAQRERTKHDADAAYWSGRLEQYHRAARAADPKHAKTVALPCGVELRSQAGKIRTEITDPPAALAWLEHHAAACVRYPPAEIEKNELVRAFGGKAGAESEPGEYPAVDGASGVVVPGVKFVRGPVTFTIK